MILNNAGAVSGLATRDAFEIDDELRGQRRFVNRWIKHENFSSYDPLKYNIALLYYKDPFALNAYLNTKRLFAYSEMSGCDVGLLYRSCSVAGFDCNNKETLSSSRVRIAPVESCVSQKTDAVNNSYACATKQQSVHASKLNSCIGSPGSALVCDNKIIALMLKTFESESVDKALYLRVDVFEDWLLKYISVGLWYDKSPKLKCRPEIKGMANSGTTIVMLLFMKCLWFICIYFRI